MGGERAQERTKGGTTGLTLGLVGAYLLLVALLLIWRRAVLTPDAFLAFAGVLAIALGRGVPFVRDWGPLALIFLGWEAARGVANQAGFPVHSDDVIAVERLISLGAMPPVDLQRAFYVPDQIGPLDVAMTAIYAAHFILPLAVAFWFWLTHRPTFIRYVVALMAMSFIQFGFALLLPVAPPRFAGQYGLEALPVTDIAGTVAFHYDLRPVSWIYANMIGNPVAAFPSLHAAYPVLAALFLGERHRLAAVFMFVYGAVVWFAIIYLGHHYLVDAIGGGALAVAVYCAALMAATSRRERMRLPAIPPAT